MTDLSIRFNPKGPVEATVGTSGSSEDSPYLFQAMVGLGVMKKEGNALKLAERLIKQFESIGIDVDFYYEKVNKQAKATLFYYLRMGWFPVWSFLTGRDNVLFLDSIQQQLTDGRVSVEFDIHYAEDEGEGHDEERWTPWFYLSIETFDDDERETIMSALYPEIKGACSGLTELG